MIADETILMESEFLQNVWIVQKSNFFVPFTKSYKNEGPYDIQLNDSWQNDIQNNDTNMKDTYMRSIECVNWQDDIK